MDAQNWAKLSKNNTFEIGGGQTHRHTHNLALYIRISLYLAYRSRWSMRIVGIIVCLECAVSWWINMFLSVSVPCALWTLNLFNRTFKLKKRVLCRKNYVKLLRFIGSQMKRTFISLNLNQYCKIRKSTASLVSSVKHVVFSDHLLLLVGRPAYNDCIINQLLSQTQQHCLCALKLIIWLLWNH